MNLHFMSKVLEKLVARRLEDHMCTNNLYDPLQSAYGSGVVGRERMGTAFPHNKLSGNGVPTREILRLYCYCY